MELLYLLPGAFFAPMIHELTKAVTSTAQGDPTPRNRGFLTLNPFKFFEPIGFLMMLFFGGFGWGQPVPTAALHYKNRRQGVLITHLAPVAVNLLVGFAAIMALSLWVGATQDASLDAFLFIRRLFILSAEWDAVMIGKLVLFAFAQCNILLAFFNLLPVHPLAMSKIIQLYAKPDTLVKLNHYEKPMQIILILLLVFGAVAMIFTPVWNTILRMAWVA